MCHLSHCGWGSCSNVDCCVVVVNVSCCSLKDYSTRGDGVSCFVIRGEIFCPDELVPLRAKVLHDHMYENVRLYVSSGVCSRLEFLFGCIDRDGAQFPKFVYALYCWLSIVQFLVRRCIYGYMVKEVIVENGVTCCIFLMCDV